MKKITVVMCCLLFAGCASNGSGKLSYWKLCDGFNAPKRLMDVADASAPEKMLRRANTIQVPLGLVEHRIMVRLNIDYNKSIASCTQALADDALQDNWLRTASLLRARAAYKLLEGDYLGATEDIENAKAQLSGRHIDEGLQQGFMVGLGMLEGEILKQRGQAVNADRLFAQAAAASRYSYQMQALVVGSFSPRYLLNKTGQQHLNDVADLSPHLLAKRADLLQWTGSNPEQVYRDWQHLVEIKHHSVAFTKTVLERLENLRNKVRKTNQKKSLNDPIPFEHLDTDSTGPVTLAKAALAAARLGKFDIAEQWMKQAQDFAELLVTNNTRINHRNAFGVMPEERQIFQLVTDHKRLFEGYRVAYQGDSQAIKDFAKANSTLILTGATVDLADMFTSQIKQRPVTPDLNKRIASLERVYRAKKSREVVVRSIFELAPVYLDSFAKNSFSQQIVFFKANGFKNKKLSETRHLVEYVGSASSRVAVDEMTLLRAAMLADKAGVKRFTINKRNEYKRYLQTTSGSSVLSSKDAGFKTSIEIELLAPDVTDKGMLAQHVIELLGPKYIAARHLGQDVLGRTF